MTIKAFTPDEATIAKLLSNYPKLDAGGLCGDSTATIAKLYERDDRDLAQEIATARLWFNNGNNDQPFSKPLRAYSLKHKIEAFVLATAHPEHSHPIANAVSAAAVVLAADLEGRKISIKDDCYFCA
jgi:hypothetical protein